ncbi:Tim10/DDP family zinc finger-domain-containing protein [Podospora didyma]|uniref:Mitochondrial import inner membrane translocase subunit n=1 Tax=Podospora didyma TaxID=330526 RepID=A0AAE0KEH2_9PEZI|nr:Tim10/DDP family zinc finger-domain-containing protein [Podospora didyma]
MDNAVDQHDIERLNDKDKAELRSFITNEQQRTRIQSQTHNLTDMCWKKCVTGPIKSGTLDKGDSTCLANCVERFLDVNIATMKHLSNMRQ